MESLIKLSLTLVLTFWSGFPYAQVAGTPPIAPAQIAIDGVSQEKGSWRLPEEHFVSAKMPMTVVHPRSFPAEDGGDETTSFARHKHAYPGIEYRIPISIQGGAYPFYYEILEGPAGMAVGQQYGDPDYGELYWTPRDQYGPHFVRIRITDQELTERIIEWDIEVGTERFVFVDASAPDGGEGTIEYPFNRFSTLHGGIYPGGGSLGNAGTSAYAAKIVYLRGGMYQVADIPTPYLSFTHLRPRVILGYPGESVEIDATNGQFRVSSQDFFISNLTLRHAPNLNLLPGTHWSDVDGRSSGSNSWLYANDNSWSMENASRAIEVTGSTSRVTLFLILAKEGRFVARISTVHPSLNGGGNNGVIHGRAVSATGYRSYMTFWNIALQDQHGVFANLYTTWYGVAENIVALPDSGGPFTMHQRSRLLFLKEQNSFWSVRRCRWAERSLDGNDGGGLYLNLNNRSGAVDNMFIEAAYNLVHSNGDTRGYVLNYHQASSTKHSVPGNAIWVYRNTLIGRLRGGNGDYTATFQNNVMMLRDGIYPLSSTRNTIIVSGPDLLGLASEWATYMDSNYLLRGKHREALLGIVGHEISGFGPFSAPHEQ